MRVLCVSCACFFFLAALLVCVRTIACHKEWTFTSSGSLVVVWRRGRQVAGWDAHDEKVAHMLVLGAVLLTASPSQLRVWDVSALCAGNTDAALLQSMDMPPNFRVTGVVHPPTYLNKVVLASDDGRLAVWNIRTAKQKYMSTVFAGSPITALQISPAVDVLAVGCADGLVALHNIRADKVCLWCLIFPLFFLFFPFGWHACPYDDNYYCRKVGQLPCR